MALHRALSCTLAASLLLAGQMARAQAPEAAPATPPPTPDKPLMSGFDAIGLGQGMKDINLNVYGFVEGSFTHNFESSPDNLMAGRVFDFQSEQLMLNQLDLSIERTVDLKKFDIGGKVEGVYGQDSGLIHSNGFLDHWHAERSAGAAKNSPENQFDVVQAYVDVAVPVGNGLDIRAGKWVTLLGYETINPTTNPFFSHTYLFGFAIPFTNTGVIGTYAINDEWSVTGGITRGWDQTFEDNNDAIDVTGEVKYTKDKLGVIVNFISGPENTGDNDHYRSVIDGIVTYKASDQLSFAVNGDFGFDHVGGIGDVHWFGVAGYASYVLDDRFTLNGRLEMFNDEEGVRTGVGANYYEGTVGVAIKPWPSDRWLSNLVLRPEFRVDYSDEEVFGGGGDDWQYSVAMDAIFTF